MTVKQIPLMTKSIQDILDGGIFYAKEMAKENVPGYRCPEAR